MIRQDSIRAFESDVNHLIELIKIELAKSESEPENLEQSLLQEALAHVLLKKGDLHLYNVEFTRLYTLILNTQSLIVDKATVLRLTDSHISLVIINTLIKLQENWDSQLAVDLLKLAVAGARGTTDMDGQLDETFAQILSLDSNSNIEDAYRFGILFTKMAQLLFGKTYTVKALQPFIPQAYRHIVEIFNALDAISTKLPKNINHVDTETISSAIEDIEKELNIKLSQKPHTN